MCKSHMRSLHCRALKEPGPMVLFEPLVHTSALQQALVPSCKENMNQLFRDKPAKPQLIAGFMFIQLLIDSNVFI